MEKTMNNGFYEMTNDELMVTDGGIDWNSIGMGLSMTAGGFIGGAIGSCLGPAGTVGGVKVGTVASTVVGGIVGGVIYSFGE